MVTSDHDRGGDGAGAHEVVDREAGPGAVAVAEPADTRGKPLEGDALRCEIEPSWFSTNVLKCCSNVGYRAAGPGVKNVNDIGNVKELNN